MKRYLHRTLAAFLLLALAPPAADAQPPLRAEPFVFDPAATGAVASSWQPFSGPGNSDPALVMSKQAPTATNAAAGATITGLGAAPRILDELGFDVFNSGHCGAGAPRYNVTTADGALYFFGCAYGTHAASPDQPSTFTRVRFGDADAFPQLASDPPWPGFGHAAVVDIQIIFDEGTDAGSGTTALDNLDVDGELIGRGH
jgi:hypothetical protein